MAKISRPILEYKEIITSAGILVDDYSPPKKTMKRFIRLLKDVEDVRIEKMTYYPLYEIVVIAFLAVLSGASYWEGIELFGKARTKWLSKFLKLEKVCLPMILSAEYLA